MQDISIQLQAQVQGFLSALQTAQTALTNIRTTSEQTNAAVADTFDGAIDGARTFLGRAADVNKVYQQMQKQLADVIKYQQVLKKLAAESNDPARVARYNAELAESNRVVAELTRSLAGLNTASSTAARAGAGMLQSFGQFALAGGVVAGITALGKEILVAAANTEQYRISFQTLTKSVIEGNQLFDDLIKISANTPFELPNLQQTAKSLLAYGFTAKGVTDEIKILGDISAGVGQDKLPQLTLAIGQVKAAGKLTGNELRQFTEAGVNIFEALQAQSGKSVTAIKKDVENGKVSFEDVNTALRGMTESGGTFFNLMAKQAKTTAGQWSNFKDVLGQVASDIGTVLLPAANAVISGLSKLTSGFKSFLGLGTEVNTSLEGQRQRFALLVNTLQDSTAATASKQRAMGTLKAEFPELLKGLDLQKASEKELNDLLSSGNLSIRERITLNKKKTELDKSAADLSLLLDKEAAQRAKVEAAKNNPVVVNGIKESDKYRDIRIKREQAALDAISSQITNKEFEAKLKQEVIKKLSKGTDTEPVKPKADLSDDQIKAREKAIADQKKHQNNLDNIREQINAEKRKFEEEERVENKKNLEKAIEENKIKLENQLAGYEKINQSIKGNGKQENELRAELSALKVIALRESGEEETKIRAEFLLKDIKAQDERNTIIEKYLADGIEKEIAAAQRSTDADKKRLEELGASKEEIETLLTRHAQNVKEIEQKYELEKLKTFESNDKGEVAVLKKDLNAQLEVQEAAFKNEKKSAKEIAEFKANQSIQREINAELVNKRLLEIDLFYATQRAEISGKPDQDNIDNIKAQIDAADTKIGALTSEKGNTGKDPKSKSIWGTLFGLDGKEAEFAEEVKDKMIGYINEVAEAQAQAAQAALDAAEERVTSAEGALDREIELAKLGFASNVSLRQEDLASAKEAQNAALEERRKAARIQLAIDTAQQVSSIAVSAANMFSAYSKIPFAGPIIAAVAIASMIGLIASTKSRAQAISQNQFEEGGQGRINSRGVVVGNRHSDGGVPLEVEGGEFFTTDGNKFAVVNRKMTAKHFGLIDAINRDDRPGMSAYLNEMVSPDRSVPERLFKEKNTNIQIHNQLEVKELKENNGLLRLMLKEMKSGEQVTDLGDFVRIKKGNRTTTMRK